MLGIVHKARREPYGRTVYLEVLTEQRICYRVVCSRKHKRNQEVPVYGIEVEGSVPDAFAAIPDFSADAAEASAFAELLIRERATPKKLYDRALWYLHGLSAEAAERSLATKAAMAG